MNNPYLKYSINYTRELKGRKIPAVNVDRYEFTRLITPSPMRPTDAQIGGLMLKGDTSLFRFLDDCITHSRFKSIDERNVLLTYTDRRFGGAFMRDLVSSMDTFFNRYANDFNHYSRKALSQPL